MSMCCNREWTSETINRESVRYMIDTKPLQQTTYQVIGWNTPITKTEGIIGYVIVVFLAFIVIYYVIRPRKKVEK